ncbi:hypothetical protein JYG23_12335 [Sedimentibacter sp. zth1]|uniref:hypothetical protein n=1 Tax=Sedimentibacter sp. zth1 TaxID=2816908 RepID=UPI001A91FBC3|nr:hypothetical protein [Sedimentibacter sp. zth1]QSX05456.1 hypothetical protein JYG23_12335 [Sedimentibacter sp. zth1]
MIYVKKHAIKRYIERIQNTDESTVRREILQTVLFSTKKIKHKKANCYAYIKQNAVAIVKLADNGKDKIVLTILKTEYKDCWWSENNKKREDKKHVK